MRCGADGLYGYGKIYKLHVVVAVKAIDPAALPKGSRFPNSTNGTPVDQTCPNDNPPDLKPHKTPPGTNAVHACQPPAGESPPHWRPNHLVRTKQAHMPVHAAETCSASRCGAFSTHAQGPLPPMSASPLQLWHAHLRKMWANSRDTQGLRHTRQLCTTCYHPVHNMPQTTTTHNHQV